MSQVASLSTSVFGLYIDICMLFAIDQIIYSEAANRLGSLH